MRRRWLLTLCLVGMAALCDAATMNLSVQPNTEADWAGDRLYRAIGSCTTPGPFTLVVTVPPTTGGALVNFTDLNIPDGTFCYRATAFDNAGNESSPSNLVEVTVDAIAPAPPVNLRLSLAPDAPASRSMKKTK